MSLNTVEDVYPLTPLQQGMLFHSLYAPGSGVYVEQLIATLRGQINRTAFARAWQYLLERHPVLRTAMAGEDLKEAIQIVHRQVRVPIEQSDWSQLSAAEQQDQLQAFVAAERRRGFKLSEAPLLRLALFATGTQTAYFVWTYHHMLLDGWSLPILL